ncbi:MAG: type I secretion system permease/ATPase [Rhizobiaceae bacterium]
MSGGAAITDAAAALKRAFAGVGLISLPINLLMLTGPLFMLQVYDRVLASGSVPTLIVLGGLTLGLYVFFGLLEGIRSRVLMRIAQRTDAQLSASTFDCAARLPIIKGRKAEKLDPVQDLDAVRQFLSGPGPAAMFDIPWMPVYLAIIFYFHTVLGWVVVAGAVIIICLIAVNEWISGKPTRDARSRGIEKSILVQQVRRNAEAIAAMGMLPQLRTLFGASNDALQSAQRRHADRTGMVATTIKSFRFMLQSLVLGVGAWLAILQEISPGIMIAASIITSRALSPVEQAVGQWKGFVGARQAFQRLKDVIGGQLETSDKLELPMPHETLEVHNLIAGPVGYPVLKQIGFKLAAGEGLGIIGPSGAGKSTLARAIVGVYPPGRGEVRLDSAELTQWHSDRRSQFIGYLPQDIQLFAGTVAQNISRFAEEIDDEEVVLAATRADAHRLITALPDGYDTVLGVDGNNLSGGQRQRIALARALFGAPFLVVLDEPNSNLDAQGEKALSEAIRTMRNLGSIVIVIAHRPSALSAVDKVLCLHEGQIQSFGPRDEVLAEVLNPKPLKVVK